MRKIIMAMAAFGLTAGSIVTAPALAQDEAQSASVVQTHVNAYRAQNMTAFLNTFSGDAVLVYEGMRFQGRDQIRAAFSLNFADGAPSLIIHNSGANGNVVWLETAYGMSDGSELCCGYSEYTVSGGKITQLVVSGPA